MTRVLPIWIESLPYFLVGILWLVSVCPALGAPSLQGYSGILNTPTAEVIHDGHLYLGYARSNDSQFTDQELAEQHNFFLTTGIFPRIELGARVSDVQNADGAFGERDLSVNLQGLVMRESKWIPAVGIGYQDLLGGAQHLEARYVVMTKSLTRWAQLSTGYGIGPDRLNGPFGSLQLRPLPYLHLMTEISDTYSAGAQMVLPLHDISPRWFPQTLSSFGITSGVSDIGGRQDRFVGAYIEIDLANLTTPSHRPVSPNAKPQISSPRREETLRRILKNEGFLDIDVIDGSPRSLTVYFQNSRYIRNELYAIRFVLKTIAQLYPDTPLTTTLVITKRGIPLLELTIPMPLYNQFVAGHICRDILSEAITIRPSRQETTKGATQAFRFAKNQALTNSDIIIRPEVATKVATERALFAAQVDIAPELVVPLFQGTVGTIKVNFPTWQSDTFASRDIDPYLSRALLHQTFKWPFGLLTQTSIGRFDDGLDGVNQEFLWQLFDGQAHLTVNIGVVSDHLWDNVSHYNKLVDSTTLLAISEVRYDFMPFNAYIQIETGHYRFGDYGAGVEIGRRFGNTSYGVFLKTSSIYDHTAGGVLEFPLTPIREPIAPRFFRPRIQETFRYALGTRVFTDVNTIQTQSLRRLDTDHTLATTYTNDYRLNSAYIRANLLLLR